MGARRNAASVEKLLLLHLVVQSFINHTNHILRLFAPLAILLLVWYFFFYHIWLKHYLVPPLPSLHSSPSLFTDACLIKGPTSDINLKLPSFLEVSYSLTEVKFVRQI